MWPGPIGIRCPRQAAIDGAAMSPISVLVVDDQELVRSGFVMILQRRDDLEVVGEAVDGREAVAAAARLQPDVILMDIRMPGLSGIDATRQIRRTDAKTKILMLTTFDDDQLVLEAMGAGADGFVLKDLRPDELADAVRTVHGGGTPLSPRIARGLVDRALSGTARVADADAINGLTARERDVLILIARGAANAEVARELVISETTVKSHVASILRKLGVRDRVQAVVAAYDTGLVRPVRD